MNVKSLSEIKDKIESLEFKENFDIVVAISRGGINPAKILSKKLQLGLEVIKINYRNDNHEIIYEQPKLLESVNFDFYGKRILLVDDVVRTGNTIKEAKYKLVGCKSIKTLVVNGSADYSLYNEECFKVNW